MDSIFIVSMWKTQQKRREWQKEGANKIGLGQAKFTSNWKTKNSKEFWNTWWQQIYCYDVKKMTFASQILNDIYPWTVMVEGIARLEVLCCCLEFVSS